MFINILTSSFRTIKAFPIYKTFFRESIPHPVKNLEIKKGKLKKSQMLF